MNHECSGKSVTINMCGCCGGSAGSANGTGVLLWENPAPGAEFPGQTITLQDADYDAYIIFFKPYIVPEMMCSCIALRPYGEQLTYAYGNGNGVVGGHRAVEYVVNDESADTLVFDNAVFASGSKASAIDNKRLVPVAVYGFTFKA